jgi:drug/metabolite transporter (DMT)-like permease
MTARQTAVLFGLGAIWGAAFMLIKIIVADVAPATLVAVRIAITALILWIVMRSSGTTLPHTRARIGKTFSRWAYLAWSSRFS